MSEAGIWWCDLGGERPKGPFTEEQVQAMITVGILKDGHRIWSSHQREWRTFSNGTAPLRRTRARRTGWGWFGLILASLPLWLLLAGAVDLVWGEGALLLPSQSVALLWPAAGAALAVVGLISALLWWVVPAKLGAAPELEAMLRICAVFITLGCLGVAGIEMRLTGMTINGIAATETWSYRIDADAAGDAMVIRGIIGRQFGERVERILARLRDPVRIEINSNGGLVTEALRAAAAIQKRHGATVIVRGRCASACLTVLMSGQHRLAAYGGVLEFHAIAPVYQTKDVLLNWSVIQENTRDEAYLVGRGVPRDLLKRADALGPQRLLPVTALTALEQGILTGLLDGNAPISASEARLRLEAAAFDRGARAPLAQTPR